MIVLTDEAPLLSVTLYVTSYTPALLVSTSFFRISISSVKFPSSLSVAVTSLNGSNTSPTVNVLSLALIIGIRLISLIFLLNSHVPTNSTLSVTLSCLAGVQPLNDHIPSDTFTSANVSIDGCTVFPCSTLPVSGSWSVISFGSSLSLVVDSKR